MKIETYEIEQPSQEIEQLAQDSEARELCEKLGLSGQLALSNNESATVFPYRRMTATEQKVFELHCPIKTKLDQYKSDAIPLRVLQVAAHAISCNVLHAVYVWHPKESRLDPVLVGYTSNYGGDLYLLARWAQVWKEFDLLLEEAKNIWQSKRIAQLKKAQAEVERSLTTVESDWDIFLHGESYELTTSVNF